MGVRQVRAAAHVGPFNASLSLTIAPFRRLVPIRSTSSDPNLPKQAETTRAVESGRLFSPDFEVFQLDAKELTP